MSFVLVCANFFFRPILITAGTSRENGSKKKSSRTPKRSSPPFDRFGGGCGTRFRCSHSLKMQPELTMTMHFGLFSSAHGCPREQSPTGSVLSATAHLRRQSYRNTVPGDRCERIWATEQRFRAGQNKRGVAATTCMQTRRHGPTSAL